MPIQHVLVVDDSKSARLMLRKMLQGFGLTVDMAESGEDALVYLRDQRTDAIFMDHTMPGMDGLTATRQIRADPATSAVPIAMYTSKDEPDYQIQARAAGAIGVLIKPAVTEVLGAMLDQMRAAVDAAAPSAASPAAPVTGLTIEQVGKLAVEKAEMVFYEAIESQVLPLLNDVVAKLRRDLDTNQRSAVEEIATRICATRLAQWRPPEPPPPEDSTVIWIRLAPRLNDRLEQFRQQERADLEELARQVAIQTCKEQLHELSGRLVRRLSARFAEAVQKAGAAARQAAVEVAQEAAVQAVGQAAAARAGDQDAATTAGAGAAEQIVQRLWAAARRDLQRRIYLAAGGAAAIGISAGLLAYVAR
ncbi:MAG: response regulator [Candidatus Competibacteraceae bacterium]